MEFLFVYYINVYEVAFEGRNDLKYPALGRLPMGLWAGAVPPAIDPAGCWMS